MAIVFSAKISGNVVDIYTPNNYYTGECIERASTDSRLLHILGRTSCWVV
jgi:hypothetical protein